MSCDEIGVIDLLFLMSSLYLSSIYVYLITSPIPPITITSPITPYHLFYPHIAASTNASVVADLGNDHDDDDHLEAVEEDEDDKGMNIDDDGDDDNDGGGMDDGSMEHPRSISISGRISSSSCSHRHTCRYENEDSLTVHNTEDYIKTGIDDDDYND